MSRTSQPTRLPHDVYDAALVAASVTSRTVPQQIAHWARIGRELEMSAQIDHRAIMRVLSGAASYDELDDGEQAIVREEWARRMTELREGLDYARDFAESGDSFSELDENGELVIRPAV